MPPQSNESKSQYQNNEKVLCFHGEFLYEAKIQDQRRTDSKDPKSAFEYKIHYKGWKNTWDDWVSSDRLRKWTDENRELAAQLRREHIQAQKPLPKTTSKSRRGQGSEIGSGRGSEERTSSVPAAGGRGSKRARDNDIEKKTPGPTSNAGPRKSASPPTVSSITPVDVEMDKDEEEPSKPQTMALKKIGQNTTADLCDFVYQPRRAAVDAAKAIHQSNQLSSLVNSSPAAPKRRKRKHFDEIGTKGIVKRPTSASHASKASSDVSKRSVSPQLLGQAKMPRVIPSKGVAAPISKRDQPATRKPGRPLKADRLSPSNKTSSRTTNSSPHGLSSAQETQDEEESDPDPGGSEYEDCDDDDDDELDSVEETGRKSSATTTIGSRKRSEREYESGEENPPAKRRITRSLTRHSNQPTTSSKRASSGSHAMISTAPSLKAGGNKTIPQNPRRAQRTKEPSKLAQRRWINKTVEDYTSSCVRHPPRQNSPQSRPHSQASYYSSLSDQVELQDPDATEDEFKDPDETKDEEFDMFDSSLKRGAALNEKDFNNLGYEDIHLQEIDGIWTAQKGTPTDDLKLDPPGSGTPYDALRWPCRLIKRANRRGTAWPKQWDEDAIRSIPDWIFKYIRTDLVSILRYDLLVNRSWNILRNLPDSSPFWPTWNKNEGTKIIHGFLTKVHADKDRMDGAEALVKLADVPLSSSSPGVDHLGTAGNVTGSGIPREVQSNLSEVYPERPSGSLRLFMQVPIPLQSPLPSPGHVPHSTGCETHFQGLTEVAQNLMPYELILHTVRPRAYMELLFKQEDAYYSRPSIRINVPDHLKNLLVDDWEHVTKSQLLVPLPSQAPANFIINEYFNEEKKNRNLDSADADVLEEFCAGLKMYFEKAVGKILLYRFERAQLAEVRKLWESGKHNEWEGRGPGDCYGAEHLTRMIVNLPEMIAQTNMDAEAVARLKTELSKFSTWLSRNSTKYFCAKYEKPSAEYHEHAR